MALQLSETVRNARLDQIESTIGTGPSLEIWSGTLPANCAAADAGDGSVLADLTLPSDWMAAAASGSKAMNGTWQDAAADATGTATHFRVKQGATCHIQGTCGQGSGDMSLDNTSLVLGQEFNVTQFTLTDGNA